MYFGISVPTAALLANFAGAISVLLKTRTGGVKCRGEDSNSVAKGSCGGMLALAVTYRGVTGSFPNVYGVCLCFKLCLQLLARLHNGGGDG